jgi:hypothetical protein
MNKVGERQTIETLIDEEALLFAKYLRAETKEWTPRIPNLLALLVKESLAYSNM